MIHSIWCNWCLSSLTACLHWTQNENLLLSSFTACLYSAQIRCLWYIRFDI